MPVRIVHRFAFPTLLLCLLLAGCATAQSKPGYGGNDASPIQQKLETKETVVYKVPKSADIVLGRRPNDSANFYDALKGVGIPYKNISRTGTEKVGDISETVGLSCPNFVVATNTLVCSKFLRRVLHHQYFNNRTMDAYTNYLVDVATVDKQDYYEITLAPKIRELKGYTFALHVVDPPQFSEAELFEHLSVVAFRFKMEVDSQYEKDSVLANFKRILGEWRGVLTAEDKDKSVFMMKRDGWEAGLTVGVWPYRGGSKAEVTALVAVQPTSVVPGVSRTVDIVKIMDEVRKEIEKVVKS